MWKSWFLKVFSKAKKEKQQLLKLSTAALEALNLLKIDIYEILPNKSPMHC